MSDFYNRPPNYVDVPVRAEFVRALERQADKLDPQHNHGEDAVTRLDVILAESLSEASNG